jgi:hypothetical protein
MAVRDPRTEWLRVQIYRRVTPAERMEIAAHMYEDSVSLVRSSILHRYPGSSPDVPTLIGPSDVCSSS